MARRILRRNLLWQRLIERQGPSISVEVTKDQWPDSFLPPESVRGRILPDAWKEEAGAEPIGSTNSAWIELVLITLLGFGANDSSKEGPVIAEDLHHEERVKGETLHSATARARQPCW